MLLHRLREKAPNLMKSYGLVDIDGPKPHEFTGFGDIDGPKPYEFIDRIVVRS